MEDSGIVDLFWSRSESALTETAAKYGPYCRAIALRILGSGEDAEECVNDALLAAWNSIPPHRPAALSAYLGKLTRRAAINRLEYAGAAKRGGGEAALSVEELAPVLPDRWSVEGALEEKRLAAALSDWLRRLPAVKRRVFICRYWYALPVRDIADKFGFSETRTANMLSRLRKELRQYLEKEDFIL